MNRPRSRLAAIAAAIALAGGLSSSALAVDGCKVLLCMAGNWRNIAACVPEVTRALRDLARGRVIPQCRMADGTTSASTGFAQRRVWGSDCPHYFRRWTWHDEGYANVQGYDSVGYWVMTCEYQWVAELTINGQPWKRTYTGEQGTLEEWQPAARAALQMGNEPIEVDLREQAWIAAGRPMGIPPTPPKYLNLYGGSQLGSYVGCYTVVTGGDGESISYFCRVFSD